MIKKKCTIELILDSKRGFVSIPNYYAPLYSSFTERSQAYFFPSKREAKLFARRLKKHAKICNYKVIIVIDDLPF